MVTKTFFLLNLLCILPNLLCMLPDNTDVHEGIKEDDCYKSCFHESEEKCPDKNEPCRCKQLDSCKKAMICCDVNDKTLIEQIKCATPKQAKLEGLHIRNASLEALHIRNATLEVLYLSLPEWKNLRSLSITDGHIKTVVGEFSMMSNKLSCLNLSSNGIHVLPNRALVFLHKLNYLDLSYNKMRELPSFKMKGAAITLNVKGNPSISCRTVSDTMNKSSINFENENSTYCQTENHFWFPSIDQVIISELRRIHELENNCILNCHCSPFVLNLGTNVARVLTVAVNCSGRNLLTMPHQLPSHTVGLDVSNNRITSLRELSDPSYKELIYLQADNNQITSIDPLEGTQFKNLFEFLSLKNNSIKFIDTYLLEFYRPSVSVRVVYLGLNKLTCDCTTMTDFKMWLQTKSDFIKDYKEIMCESDDEDKRLIDLDPSKYCQSHEDWTDYIYYIIGAEVFLLVSLITKVSYDYWVFKTAGYLPWPASKMPKLPCDWLCE